MSTRSSIPSRRAMLAGSAATLLLAGCSGVIGPSSPPFKIYLLAPDLGALPGPKVSWELSIARPDAALSFNTDRIAIARAETLDYYADAQWSDNTPLLLESLLVEAFEKSGRIDTVAKDAESVRADYILETELRAFQARYADENGAPTVAVDIMAKLLDARSREIIAVHEAKAEAPAAVNTIDAAVAAFDKATSAILEEIVAWVLSAGHTRR
jgi:cholesterol transport system auxiliary component